MCHIIIYLKASIPSHLRERERKKINGSLVAPSESHKKINQMTQNGNKTITTDSITSTFEKQNGVFSFLLRILLLNEGTLQYNMSAD